MGKANTGWAVRKVAYIIISIVMLVLVALGIVSEGTSENIITQVTPIVGAIATAIAASKTHRGSDSTATDADVRNAASENAPRPQVTPLEIADVLAERFGLGVDSGRHHLDDPAPAATADGGYPPATPGV